MGWAPGPRTRAGRWSPTIRTRTRAQERGRAVAGQARAKIGVGVGVEATAFDRARVSARHDPAWSGGIAAVGG